MLQQTQVSRVKEKLPVFFKKFPTLKKLSQASKADVIRGWQGLGYNNRAVRLHEFAKTILINYDGRIPTDVPTLQQLPGIGPYTAHALACFAFRQRVPVVDVNIRRVLSRMFWRIKTPTDLKNERAIWQLAEEILPNDAYAWHQALMDLGSTICHARKPLCAVCPVRTLCCSSHLHKTKIINHKSKIVHREPSYLGIPRRFWRGKIVEALRNVNGRGSMTLFQLGREIKQDFTQHEIPWLKRIVRLLENDGVAAVYKKGTSIHVGLAHE
jgi:A/G-specific adenine glycosylase